MKASDLFVKCLENEGVNAVFGLPGEEVLDLLDSICRSSIRFIPVRHEQGAAFMADVHGRLTGRAGVCLSTLGPGATNLMTGIADAYLDRAPLVAITGQISLEEIHKESHQFIDVVDMLRPVTKWNTRIARPDVIPEVVRKAFKLAQIEKPGATHLELPENIAAAEVEGAPLAVRPHEYPRPSSDAIQRAAAILRQAEAPVIIAGNGVIRMGASEALRVFAEKVHIPGANTFMGKGAIDYRSDLSLLTVGLQARDWVMIGLDRADVVVAIGYDLVEYAPRFWNPDKKKRIIHVDSLPAEVDEYYQPEVEIVCDLNDGLWALAGACKFRKELQGHFELHETILGELARYADDQSFPVKPQKIVADLRKALDPDDILISDVGMHKLWIARMFQASRPNTVLISNGFASMGIALPGAIAAKLARPERRVVAVAGDGAIMMNIQELETAGRLGTPLVAVVWTDNRFGMIEWKEEKRFGRSFGVEFNNPDFVRLAESFGIPGFRVEAAADLLPTLERALAMPNPVVVEVPVDYRENQRLTAALGELTSTI